MKSIKGFAVLFFLLVLQVPHARAAHENSIDSAWLVTPVEVDGDITYSNEWSDANNIDLVIGTNYGRSPPFLETKLWVKNDPTHIFFLVCIKYQYLNYDLKDNAYLYYMIHDGSMNIIFSDKTVTGQLGDTYGYADSPIDTEEHLCVGLHDHSEDYDMQAFIQITICSPETRSIIPVGGTVEDIPELEIIKPIILRVLVCSVIIILATVLARYIR